MRVSAIKVSVVCVLIMQAVSVNAQFPEYRITDDGQYQYLNNHQSKDRVFDETQGIWYKAVTIRTFYLDVHEKGFLPDDVSYEDFREMTPDSQRALLKQPFEKPLDCSIGQTVPEGCIVYKTGSDRRSYKGNGSTGAISPKRSSAELSKTTKIITNEK